MVKLFRSGDIYNKRNTTTHKEAKKIYMHMFHLWYFPVLNIFILCALKLEHLSEVVSYQVLTHPALLVTILRQHVFSDLLFYTNQCS